MSGEAPTRRRPAGMGRGREAGTGVRARPAEPAGRGLAGERQSPREGETAAPARGEQRRASVSGTFPLAASDPYPHFSSSPEAPRALLSEPKFLD